MTILRALYLLAINLPQVIRLIEAMAREARRRQAERELAHDFKAIEDAFNRRDPDALRRVFDGVSDDEA